MNRERHHIVRNEADQPRPLVYLTSAAKRRRRISDLATTVLIIALLLVAGVTWVLVGAAVMRGDS